MSFEETLSAYDYRLPPDLIAQAPVEPRDTSRLLVLHRATGELEHRTFRDLPEYFSSQDVFVANNSKVIKARLLGHRIPTGGKIEFLLLEEKSPQVWEGMFHAAAKHRPGVEFEIPTPDGHGLRGKLIRGASDSPHGTVEAEFDRDPISSGAGELPLPHYIKRHPEAEDDHRYQTVYARENGSAAAPTAGLHFTVEVLNALKSRGVRWEEVTLHVGLGTFRPVKAENIKEHPMHEERYEVGSGVAERLNQAKRSGKRIVAVGTTSVRTLESAWWEGSIQGGFGKTALFIRPGAFEFHVVDALLTNFHLPKSTLLMLVSAFAGREHVLHAYEEAVRLRYRFFSYGDSMLIV